MLEKTVIAYINGMPVYGNVYNEMETSELKRDLEEVLNIRLAYIGNIELLPAFRIR